MLRNVRTGLGLLLLAGSTLLLIWGYRPAHRELRVRPVAAAQASEAGRGDLTLLFPPKIRIGEPAVVRLTLDVDALQAFLPGESSNVYESHNVIAESRFDIPGIPVQPSEVISAPVSEGQTAVFYWTLRPKDAGKFRGTIWLYLRTVDKLTGQESRETVSAQIVEIESVKFLGLVVNRARTIAWVGAALGILLSLPFFETLALYFYRKRRNPL
jgi:hypothetical protein